MPDVYVNSDIALAFKEQKTWGTAEDDTDEVSGIVSEAFGNDSQINFINLLSSRTQRYFHQNNITVNQKGRVFETTKFRTPALKNQLDIFLYSIFQNVVETTAGVNYKKTFTFQQRQPDFTSSEGKYFTVWTKQPVASNSQKINDAIFSELNLNCSPDNDGILWIDNINFIARNHTDLANPTGNILYPTVNNYYFYDLTKAQIDSTDLVLGDRGLVINIKNNAKRIGIDTGKFKTYLLPRYEIELQVHILDGTLARALMAKAKVGSSVSFEFQWGTADQDGYLNISGTAKLSQAVNIEHGDINYCNVVLSCVGEYGITEPFQIIMINTEIRHWGWAAWNMIFQDGDNTWQDRTEDIFQDR